MKPSSPLHGAVFPDEIIVGLDDMDTSSLTGAILTHLMTRTAMYSKTITVLGTIPQKRQNAASHQSNLDPTVTTEAPTAIPVRQLLMKMTLSDCKEEKSPRAADAPFGSPASSSLQDASEISKAVRDAPVAKIGGEEHQTMVADSTVTPSDIASLPEPDARSIPVARDEAKKVLVVEAASDMTPSDSVEVDAKLASSQLQDASGASKTVDDAAVFGASPVGTFTSERPTAEHEAVATPSDAAEPDARSAPVMQDDARINIATEARDGEAFRKLECTFWVVPYRYQGRSRYFWRVSSQTAELEVAAAPYDL